MLSAVRSFLNSEFCLYLHSALYRYREKLRNISSVTFSEKILDATEMTFDMLSHANVQFGFRYMSTFLVGESKFHGGFLSHS